MNAKYRGKNSNNGKVKGRRNEKKKILTAAMGEERETKSERGKQ